MLADRFPGDNYQSFQGPAGANHFMLGTGDAGWATATAMPSPRL